MQNSQLTEAIKEAYANTSDDDVLFETLEFVHSSFLDEEGNQTPIRVVRDYQDLEATLEDTAPVNAGQKVKFIRFAFDIVLPEISQGASKEITITIDNVSQLIGENIDRSKDTNEKIIVIYRPFLLSDLSQPQINPPYQFILRSVEVNEMQVVGKASFEIDFTNRSFPSDTYTSERFPGLVR
jgi:hypothetical protein